MQLYPGSRGYALVGNTLCCEMRDASRETRWPVGISPSSVVLGLMYANDASL